MLEPSGFWCAADVTLRGWEKDSGKATQGMCQVPLRTPAKLFLGNGGVLGGGVPFPEAHVRPSSERSPSVPPPTGKVGATWKEVRREGR